MKHRQIWPRLKRAIFVTVGYAAAGFGLYCFLASAPLLIFAYAEELARWETVFSIGVITSYVISILLALFLPVRPNEPQQ